MPRPVRLILLILLIAGTVFFVSRALNDKSGGEENVIRVSGNIEVTDAEVSFKIAGLMQERLVNEGEMVTAGQPAARLESRDLQHEVAIKKAEVDAAAADLAELLAGSRVEDIAESRAAVERAQSNLDELLAGSRPEEIAASQATVDRARADMENLRVEMQRYKKLYQEGFASAEKYDKAKTDHEMAEAQVKQTLELLKLAKEGPRKENIDQARAALREAKERYKKVKKGPREEAIDQVRARLSKAKAELALAETRIGYAEVVSPLTGVVLSENIEAGEYVVPGTPVVTVGDLVNVWVRGYVNETDLGRVKLGQSVHVRSDTYPDKIYDGKISFIASQAEFTPKSVQTEKERVKLVFRIKVDIRNPAMELKPGMPVDADILLNEAGHG